jgi:endoglucanase
MGYVGREAMKSRSAIGLAIAMLVMASNQLFTVAQSGSAFVRVNQLGYVAGAAKRAYLMASGAESSASFQVHSGSGVVYAAPVGPNLGAWSTAYPFVYALDFDAVTASGSYKISVSGPVSAASLSFRIDNAAQLYSVALANALSFYQNERDGPNFIPSPLRTAAGHLNDQHAMTYLTPPMNVNGRFAGDLTPLGITIDASGGWWDAGDYLKFVETHSYTVGVLLSGVRDFPGQMGAGSLGSNFTRESRFGLDWLQRMWDSQTKTLYYQVGIGNGNPRTVSDHDIWRLPQLDDTYGGSDPLFRYIRNRPVFRAGAPGSLISPNLAGRLAASDGLCFQVFRDTDPAYAGQCLRAGEQIFDLADTAPNGALLTVAPHGFYPEKTWHDDMEWGATELSLALAGGNVPSGLPRRDPGFYLQQAAHWANAYITGREDAADTLNLYDVSALAHYDLFRAITGAANPQGLEVTPARLAADLKKQLDNALAQGATDPFGFGFPWAAFDTTTHGSGLAVTASMYAHLTGTRTYADMGRRWLANILGANAWGTSLIVGDGAVFPNCMQHQVANLVGSTDGNPPVLSGAAVEGPNSFAATGVVSGMVTCPPSGGDPFAVFNGKTATYQDNVQSWSTVEPAIDLTATSPLAFAWQIAGN